MYVLVKEVVSVVAPRVVQDSPITNSLNTAAVCCRNDHVDGDGVKMMVMGRLDCDSWWRDGAVDWCNDGLTLWWCNGLMVWWCVIVRVVMELTANCHGGWGRDKAIDGSKPTLITTWLHFEQPHFIGLVSIIVMMATYYVMGDEWLQVAKGCWVSGWSQKAFGWLWCTCHAPIKPHHCHSKVSTLVARVLDCD